MDDDISRPGEGVCLVVDDGPPPLEPPAGEPTLRLGSGRLDNLYRYNLNSVDALNTYRDGSGNLRQALVYWADDRRLHVMQRDFPNGRFEPPLDIHGAIGGEPLEWDAHNWCGWALAPDGTIFVTGNHHSDQLNMARSARPLDWRSLEYVAPSAMGARDVDRVTYPSFFTLRDRLHFSYREQEVGGGEPRFRWMIKRYDHERDAWQTAAQINEGINLRCYVSPVEVSPDGRRAHLFAVWRDDQRGGGTAAQRDLWHLYSDDGTTWRQYGLDDPADLPLWYDNGRGGGISLVPRNIWTTPPDPVPVTSGEPRVDAAGKPHVLIEGGGAMNHIRHDGTRWRSTPFPHRSSGIALVRVGGGMGAVFGCGGDVCYASLDPNEPSYRQRIEIASGFIGPEWRVRLDTGALRRGYASFPMSRSSNRANLSVTRGGDPQEVAVATYPVGALASVGTPLRA